MSRTGSEVKEQETPIHPPSRFLPRRLLRVFRVAHSSWPAAFYNGNRMEADKVMGLFIYFVLIWRELLIFLMGRKKLPELAVSSREAQKRLIQKTTEKQITLSAATPA